MALTLCVPLLRMLLLMAWRHSPGSGPGLSGLLLEPLSRACMMCSRLQGGGRALPPPVNHPDPAAAAGGEVGHLAMPGYSAGVSWEAVGCSCSIGWEAACTSPCMATHSWSCSVITGEGAVAGVGARSRAISTCTPQEMRCCTLPQ